MAKPENLFFDRSKVMKQGDDDIDELVIEPLICDSWNRDICMNKAKASDPQKEKDFGWIDAQVWCRKDSKPVSDMENWASVLYSTTPRRRSRSQTSRIPFTPLYRLFE